MATNACWLAVHVMATMNKQRSFKNCTDAEIHEIALVYENCRGNFKLSDETKSKIGAAKKRKNSY